MNVYKLFLIFINVYLSTFQLQLPYFCSNNSQKKVVFTNFIQKQPFGLVLSKRCSKKLSEIWWKISVRNLLLIKLATVLKKRLQHTCFSVNFGERDKVSKNSQENSFVTSLTKLQVLFKRDTSTAHPIPALSDLQLY